MAIVLEVRSCDRRGSSRVSRAFSAARWGRWNGEEWIGPIHWTDRGAAAQAASRFSAAAGTPDFADSLAPRSVQLRYFRSPAANTGG